MTTPVTTAPDGTLADKWSLAPSISDDGSTVAFFSFASNLVGDAYQECRPMESGEAEPCGSLYIYDVDSGALERIAVAAAPSTHPDTALSADGRYVAFAAPQAYLREGVFLYDRGTGDMTPISPGDSSEPPPTTNSGGFAVDISADGRYVAFASLDDDIVPDDTNGGIDVFVYDRIAAQIERISTPVDGIESGQPSGYQAVPNTGGGFESGLSISADGRYVVFMSAAPNLVDRHLSPCQHWPWVDAFPACRHIYLHDREMGTTELISVSDDGTPGNRASEDGDVSAGGRWVVFTSLADNLTADGPIKCQDYTMEGACLQVYVRDREQGRTYLVSRGWNGQLPNANSSAGVITPDGRYVAFISSAGNLVPDVPFSQDRHIFIADLFRLIGCVETPVTPTFLPPVPVATATQMLQPSESPAPPLATPTSSQAPTSTLAPMPTLLPTSTPTSPQTPVAGDCAGPFCRTGTAQAELSRSSASWTSRGELAIPLDEAMLALDAALRGEIAAYLNAYLNPTHPLVDQMDALDALRAALPNAGDKCTILPANLDCDQFDELVVWNCANMPAGLLFTVTEEGYSAQSLPVVSGATWILPQLWYGTLDAQDVTGDGCPELLLSYILPGGSMMTEKVYFLAWNERNFQTLFSADLVDWVGRSNWTLELNPAGGQDVVLRYPHFYSTGFEAKLILHPWAAQRWQWDPVRGRYTLRETTIDLDFESNLPDHEWEEDVLRQIEWEWMRVLVDEAELHYQAGNLEEARTGYQSVLSYGALLNRPEERTAHWPAYARFRIAQVQAMLGQADAAQAELSALLADLDQESNLRPLVEVFDEVFDLAQPDAALRATATLHGLRLYEQFYWHDDRPGDLTLPMNMLTLLWPGTPLARYLDAHPEAMDGPPSPEQEQALGRALSELGFPVASVRIVDLNADGLLEVLVTTDETDQPNGPLFVWLLAQMSGRWHSHRWPYIDYSLTEEVTEEPLPDGRIILRWGDPTLSWSEEKIAFVWTGDALVEVDPETYEPLPPGWPAVGGLHF